MSENRYLDAASRVQVNPDDEHTAAAYNATQVPAEQFGKAKRNGALVGLPPTLAMTDPDLERRAQAARTLESLRVAPPATRQFVGGPDGPIAQDDVDNLSATEKALRLFGEYVLRPIGGEGVGRLNQGLYGLAWAPAEIGAKGLDYLVKAEILPGNPMRDLANFLKEGAAESGRWADTYGIAAGDYNTPLERGIASGVASLYQSLQLAPVGAELQGTKAVTQVGKFFLPETRALAPMGAVSFGQSYSEAREKGLGLANSISYAGQQAGIEMMTEALPFGELLANQKAGSTLLGTLGRSLLEENLGEQVATHWQDLNDWLYLNPEKTFQDYLNERPNAALETAIATTFATGLQTGAIHLANEAARKADAQRAEQHAEMLGQLNKLTAASRVLARDPKTFQGFVDGLVADGVQVDTLYIDGQALMQAGIADQVAAASPTVREQLAEAVATGGSVAIPLSEYATTLAPTPLGDQLLDHVRATPESMSRAEAQATIEEEGATVVAAVERSLEKAKVDKEFKKSQQAVKDRVKQELDSLKRFNTQTNDLYATLIAARSAVRAAQLGITPEQFFDKQLLKVQSEGMTEGSEAYNTVQKSVTARTEELQAAAQQVKDGTMTREEYAALVDRYKPVLPYEGVPDPATEDAMREALVATNREKADRPKKDSYLNAHLASLKEGDPVGLRLDIPSYTERNTWVVTVHGERKSQNSGGAGVRLGYASVAAATNVVFTVPQRGAINIAAGDPKTTIATMEGRWKNVTPEEAKAQADAALKDPDWVQVGMDPERHGYFYDRATMQPVVSADEVIQIGPLVLARNAVYGDPENYLYQRRDPIAAGEAIPESVDSAGLLTTNTRLANSQVWNRGRDLKMAMQENVLAAAANAGADVSTPSEAQIDYAVRMALADAREALKQNANAIGWYDLKTRQALAVMSLVHPEIATDENAKFAFVWALAVCSNGQKVEKNFQLAEEAYVAFKRDGVMPTNLTAGQAQKAINKSLGMFNELRAEWGVDNLRQFMLTNFTVAEVAAIDDVLKPSGEFADTNVRGASILGPKIGNGFFSNLYGHFDALTMDRWLVRTWGRWTGTLIQLRPEQTAKSRQRLKEAVAAIVAEPAELARLQAQVPGLAEGLDEAGLDALAMAVQKASMDVPTRAELNKSPLGEELRKAGNTLAKELDGQKEAPAGPEERNRIREVFGRTLEQLRQEPGYADLTMADLQAVLWYAEKRLYESAKEDVILNEEDGDTTAQGYEDEDAPDYANAAVKVARDKGVDEGRISRALKKEANRGRTTAARQGNASAPGAAQGQPSQVGSGFSRSELNSFIGYRAIVRARRNRQSSRDPSWAYSRKAARDDGGPRVLKTLGVRFLAKWSPGTRLGNLLNTTRFNKSSFLELDSSDPATVGAFVQAISSSKAASGANGAAVYIYQPEDYAGMRLFLTEDGRSGFALKTDGDLVSAFATKDPAKPDSRGSARAMLECGIAAGARKLDCFDTVLPKLYAAHGFRTVARLKWNDEYAPPNWDKTQMAAFNKGEPDVVYMVYDPDHFQEYSAGDGPVMKDQGRGKKKVFGFGLAAEAQEREMARVSARAEAYPQSAIAALPDYIDIDGVRRSTRDDKGLPLAPPVDYFQPSELVTGEAGVRAFWAYYRNGPVDHMGRPVSFYRGVRREATAGELVTEGRETLSFTADPGIANIYANHQVPFKRARYGVGSGTMRYYINTQKILDLRGNGETTSLWGFIDALGNWNLEKQRGDKGEAGYLQIADAVMSLDDVTHNFGVDWSSSDYDSFSDLADAFVEACEEQDYDLAEALLSEVEVDIYALLDAEFGTLAATAGYDSVYHDDPLTDEAVSLYTGNKDDLEYDQNYDGRSTATLRPLSSDMAKTITNVGSYSRSTDPLYQAVTGMSDQVFYSALLRAAETAKITKGNANQWLGTLRNMPGVKPDELAWLGLEEWLKDKGTATREEVAEFIRENQVILEESFTTTTAPTPVEWPDDPLLVSSRENPDAMPNPLGGGRDRPVASWKLPFPNGNFMVIREINRPLWGGTIFEVSQPGYSSTDTDETFEEAVQTAYKRAQSIKWVRGTDYSWVNAQGGINYREGVLRVPVRTVDEMAPPTREWNERDNWWSFQFSSYQKALQFKAKAGHDYTHIDQDNNVVSVLKRSRETRLAFPDENLTGAALEAKSFSYFSAIASTLHGRQFVPSAPGMQKKTVGNLFRGGHFENNVLMHMRWEHRVTADDAARALHIVELQSDWHQAGRKKGYAPFSEGSARDYVDSLRSPWGAGAELPPGYKIYDQQENYKKEVTAKYEAQHGPQSGWSDQVRMDWAHEVDQLIAEHERMYGTGARFVVENENGTVLATNRIRLSAEQAAWSAYTDRIERAVPAAPFKTNWHEVAFKRLLQQAVLDNVDYITWPGSAEFVAKIESWGDIDVVAGDNGDQYFTTGDTNVTAIVNRYLQDLPRFANKYVAKWKGKVERNYVRAETSPSPTRAMFGFGEAVIKLDVTNNPHDGTFTVVGYDANGKEVATGVYTDTQFIMAFGHGVRDYIEEQLDADDYSDGLLPMEVNLAAYQEPEVYPVFRIKITPEMRESVLAGQALFQPQGPQPEPRGEFIPSRNLINLLKGADLSTFLHETGHYFFENDIALAFELAQKAATQPLSDGEKEILRDVGTLLRWHGIEGDLPAQLNTWNAMSFEERRTAHERTAESFERYLFEGKAPSLELQPVFQRFKQFLLRVYRSLKDFLQGRPEADTLTDEVRGVFDRMLATEAQIAMAERSRSMAPMFDDATQANMTPDEWTAYQALLVDASEEAVAALQARGLRDMTWLSNLKARTVKALSRSAAQKRKAVRAEMEAEVLREPVYAVQRWLKTGEMTLPDNEEVKVSDGHKLDRAAVEALYPTKAGLDPVEWRKLGFGKYGMLATDGMAPDLVAAMFGFSSGDQLVRAILAAPPLRDRVEAETDRVMLERHGDLTDPKAISKAADQEIHNEVRLRFLATELAALQQAVGQSRLLAKMAKEQGERLAGRVPLKRLATKARVFANAAARAGRLADEAFRAGDVKEAARQKRLQLINHAATHATYQAQRDHAKTKTLFQRVLRGRQDDVAKQRNMDLVNTARAILAAYGAGKRAQAARTYLDLVKTYDPTLYAALEPSVAQADANAKPMEDLTVDEMRSLSATVESLWRLAKREKEIEIDGRRISREDAAQQLADAIAARGIPTRVPGEGGAPTPAEERARSAMGLVAIARRVESWVTRMDEQFGGAFRTLLWTPISEGADNYRADSARYLKQYRALLERVAATLMPGRIDAPELGYTFGMSRGDAGMSELLHAILHTGNDSNKRKLLLGRGWASENPDGTLNTTVWDGFVERMIREGKLTAEHFHFAQGVWDLLESMKPLAQQTHREVFGRYFDEVTANEVKNSLGTWRGGYVPALVDTFQVMDAAIHAELDALNEGNGYMFPATARGFTQKRVEYNKPLLLDLRTLSSHIDKVLLFSHMEARVRDTTRLLRDPKVSGLLTRYDAVAYNDMLLPWLNRASKQVIETPATGAGGRAGDRFWRALRSRAGASTMFANLVNTFQQVTGLSIAALRVKGKYLRPALVRHIRQPGEMAEAIAALSPFMANRMENQALDMRQQIDAILLNPSLYEKAQQWSAKHAYFLQSAAQNFVDCIVWAGAYDQAVDEGATDKEAVRQANSAVRETQGSLNPEDVSRFEAGPAFIRLFTQFASYFNMQANLLGTDLIKVSETYGLKRGAGKAMFILTLGMMVPAWVSEIIVLGSRGGPDDEDKDGYTIDEWLAALFGAPLRNATAMVPVAGQMAVLMANSFNRKPYDDRLSTAPAVSAIEAAVSAPNSIYEAVMENGRPSRAIRDTATAVSIVTGVPLTPVAKPLGYWADVASGKTQPESVMDAARGTVVGR